MKKFLITIFVFIFSNCEVAQAKEYFIKIENHQFKPDVIEVKADEEFKLIIENLDKTVEEFESNDLKKEKLVGGGKKIKISIQALKAGQYNFFGDFHQKTAQGKLIAR